MANVIKEAAEALDGRWLIVGNLSIEPISVPHPDRDAKDTEHLALSGFEEQVIGEEWLESPVFLKEVGRSRLSLRRSDQVPTNEFLMRNVVDSLTKEGWEPHQAMTIWQICALDPIPEQFDYLIELEPTTDSKQRYGNTSISARWDLLANHLPWLKAVRELERRWRKRKALLARLDSRIVELESM